MSAAFYEDGYSKSDAHFRNTPKIKSKKEGGNKKSGKKKTGPQMLILKIADKLKQKISQNVSVWTILS